MPWGELTNCWKLCAIDTDHAKLADLASSTKIEHGQSNNTNLLVRAGGTAADEAGGVLTSTDLTKLVIVSLRFCMLETYHQHIEGRGHVGQLDLGSIGKRLARVKECRQCLSLEGCWMLVCIWRELDGKSLAGLDAAGLMEYVTGLSRGRNNYRDTTFKLLHFGPFCLESIHNHPSRHGRLSWA